MKLKKNNHKEFTKNSAESNISGTLPIMCFVDDGIIKTSNNTLFGTLKIEGVNVSTASTEQINYFDNLLHNLISSLDDRFGVVGHVLRRKMPMSFHIKSNSKFTESFNTKYRQQFEDAKLYSNEIYLTIFSRELNYLTKDKSSAAFGFASSLFKKGIYGQEHKKDNDFKVDKCVRDLKELLKRFQNQLGNANAKDDSTETKFYATRLDEKTSKFSEMMRFLGSFVNGLDNVNYATPSEELYSYSRLDENEEDFDLPYGNVADYLANQSINFGSYKYFKFSQNKKIGNMVSIKKYSSDQNPLSLHNLFKVDCEMIYTVSFLPTERSKSIKKIERKTMNMENAKDAGNSELADLDDLKDDILSEKIVFGDSSISIMVLSSNKEDLQNKTNQVQRIFGEVGYNAFVEDKNHEGAFLSQFPANFKYMVRSRPISSAAFCHLFPMQNFPTGHTNRTHLGEAICLVKTPSNTPMYLNYHKKGSGSKTDFVAGHGNYIGSNGSGKTSTMLMVDSLMEKYDCRLFFFDRNNGAEIYIEAGKGRYIDYSFDNKGIKHNPFALSDTAENRAFIVRLLSSMVRRVGEDEISSKVSKQLRECVDYAYDHVPANQRNLSTVVNLSLSSSFERMDELHEFMRGDGIRNDGKYANFFDNQEEGFEFDTISKYGFDTTKLLKEKKLTGVITYYIFYRIMQLLEKGDGRPTAIILDEGWSYLADPYFANELFEAFPTLRKINAFIVLATQSASTILECSIRNQIMDNLAFKMYFPNPDADYERVYKHLNILEHEFRWIKTTPLETRQAMYIQGHDKAIIDLGLQGFDKELAVISGNSTTIALKRKIQQDLGTKDPDVWLPEYHRQLGFEND